MCALSNLALFNEKLSTKVLPIKPSEIDTGKICSNQHHTTK
jgi:hypothetical protein